MIVDIERSYWYRTAYSPTVVCLVDAADARVSCGAVAGTRRRRRSEIPRAASGLTEAANGVLGKEITGEVMLTTFLLASPYGLNGSMSSLAQAPLAGTLQDCRDIRCRRSCGCA